MDWSAVKGQRRGFWLVAALLFCALVLGGGGRHAPLLVGIIEALAVFVLLHFGLFADHDRIGPGGATALLLVATLLLVGLLQLVPLPPAVWKTLGGRDLLAASLSAQGFPDARWGVSLVPQATRASLLTMLPPVAMFAAVIHLEWSARRLLCILVGIVAILSALLGLFQVAGGESPAFNPYGLGPFGVAVGFFANRNHQAVFLDGAILLAGVLGVASVRAARSPARALGAAAALLPLALGVLGTSSRSGVALLAIAIAALLLLHLLARGRATGLARPRRGRRLAAAAIGALSAVVAVALLADSYPGARLIERYQQLSVGDGRNDFWPDVLYVAKLYAPAGAGFGTFDTVFESAEPLATVTPLYIVHAHNDYVELFIECGVAAVAIIGGFLLWFLWRTASAWRAPILAPGAATRRAASVVVLLFLLHALVDYPLRTEANATLFALACALLVPLRDRPRGVPERGSLPAEA